MNGTAVSGEPVVVIEVENGAVHLNKGRVVSDRSTDGLADNFHRILVSRDGAAHKENPLIDDARETEYNADNIHLLKVSEAKALRDPISAYEWFGTIYQDWVVAKIQRALKRLKL